ncbi:MAG: AAA family ATPase [Candidatus Parvarchaeota archaeon]
MKMYNSIMEGLFIIGLSSLPGGGKDYVADILVNRYHFHKISPGDMIRRLLKKMNLPVTREGEQRIQADYKKRYGKDFLMKRVYDEALRSGDSRIVIPGIRSPGDIKFFKKRLGNNFKNVFIICAAKTRYNRMKRRNRQDAPKSIADFIKQDAAERRLFDLDETRRLSDFKLRNDIGSRRLEKDIKKILDRSGLHHLATR